MKKIIPSLLFIIDLFFTMNASAQSLPDAITQKIDALFADWNNSNTPGCAVGIIRNDSLIYAKGYGMANLEFNTSITAETRFNMCSISKQFTAYCILLLARQGKINLDADIHTYLPNMPDYGTKVTVRNLLNHTSGIRDDDALFTIAGINGYGIIRQDDGVRTIQNQKQLNFQPGSKFLYSNSNYTLLADIVKVVSGKSFRVFVDSAIFKKLGMSHSFFRDDYREIVNNIAHPYNVADSAHYINATQTEFEAGCDNLYSSVDDMAKWLQNFYNPQAGDTDDINQLTQKPTLMDGSENHYAKGIIVNIYKGWRQFWHDGDNDGYHTTLAVFPDLKMGFVLFTNNDEFPEARKIDALKSMFISDTSHAVQQKTADDSIIHNMSFIKNFTGKYVSDDANLATVSISDNKLYIYTYDETQLLKRDANNNYHPADYSYVALNFSIDKTTRDTTVTESVENMVNHYIKYTPQHLTVNELKQYIGTYYCAELQTSYNISLIDGSLYITGIRYIDMPLTGVNKNRFTSDFYGLNLLEFTRDNKSIINGFEANCNRTWHLRFDKMK